MRSILFVCLLFVPRLLADTIQTVPFLAYLTGKNANACALALVVEVDLIAPALLGYDVQRFEAALQEPPQVGGVIVGGVGYLHAASLSSTLIGAREAGHCW